MPFANDDRADCLQGKVLQSSQMQPKVALAGFPVPSSHPGMVTQPCMGIDIKRLLPELFIEPGTTRDVSLYSGQPPISVCLGEVRARGILPLAVRPEE